MLYFFVFFIRRSSRYGRLNDPQYPRMTHQAGSTGKCWVERSGDDSSSVRVPWHHIHTRSRDVQAQGRKHLLDESSCRRQRLVPAPQAWTRDLERDPPKVNSHLLLSNLSLQSLSIIALTGLSM